jgi:hypothetical protein
VRLSANCRCPERRSDDGQTILEGTQTGPKSCPDLLLLVELSGLGPLTSCMPYPANLFSSGADLAGCPGARPPRAAAGRARWCRPKVSASPDSDYTSGSTTSLEDRASSPGVTCQYIGAGQELPTSRE